MNHVVTAQARLRLVDLGRVRVVWRCLCLHHDRSLRNRDDLTVGRGRQRLGVEEEIATSSCGAGCDLLGLRVEQVIGRTRCRALVIGALRLLLGCKLDSVVETVDRSAGRIRTPRLRDYIRLPVVEVELRGRAHLILGPVGVAHIGQSDPDRVSANPGNLRLGNSQLVGPLADDLDRSVYVLPVDLRVLRSRSTLINEFSSAAKIESQHGRLGGDHYQRGRKETGNEEQDEEVAAPVAHSQSASGVSTSKSPPSSS